MSQCGETIKKADIFYQDLEILFENGKSKLQSHCGVVLGAIMVTILVAYGVLKAQVMIEYRENTI